MSLASGTRLGSYEIAAKLGAGGMGEVYRARDTKLNRDVAIKVLPEAFALDAERLARFTREAQVLASLNHPYIAAIHGLEEHGRTRALVMELVEGEDLSKRIARGAIPLDEALPLARQIAEALEAAHEQGIVHRDLKPANIKVRNDGTVKVLDFGLAKALDPAATSDVAAMNSPTITSPAMTMRGMILGTAAYMSPEQARGKPVDRRADIWAFGVVLFEMLTGRRVFEAAEVSDVLAAVLRAEPEWTRLPADTPASVRTLLRRCLQKDAKKRLADAADARLEIEDALASPVAALPAALAAPASRRWVTAAAILALATAVLSALVVYDRAARQPTTPQPRPAAVVTITFPGVSQLQSVAISSDGRRIAVAGRRSSTTTFRLFVRDLNQLGFREIPNTDNARLPFFSPDGQWIAFFTSRELKKVPADGGVPVVLAGLNAAGTDSSLGGSWGTDDTILFSSGTGISRVGASGGAVVAMTTTAGAEWHAAPQHLLGGSPFLFAKRVLSAPAPSGFDTPGASDLEIAVQDSPGAQPRPVLKDAFEAVYSQTGHLFFRRSGTLLAAPFDPQTLAVGPATPVAEGLEVGRSNLQSQGRGGAFSVSSANSLVYLSPSNTGALRELVWVDRTGRTQPVGALRRRFDLPRLSPSGTLVAVNDPSDEIQSAWVYDLERKTLGRLSVDPPGMNPHWSPDGTRIAFENRGAGAPFFVRPSDGTGPVVPIDAPGLNPALQSWSSDGRSLLYQLSGATTDRDLWTLDLEGERAAAPLVATRFFEGGGTLSPDGKLVAWVSSENGVNQVYVQTYPAGAGRVQVSVEGGVEPVWARSGKELFYRRDDKMLSVSVSTTPSLKVGAPSVLFEGRFEFYGGARPNYDVSGDGRFLMLRAVETPSTDARLIYIADWPQLLVDKKPVVVPDSRPQ